MLLSELLNRQPRWLIMLVGFFLVALIGWMDRETSWEWSFSALYAAPIAIISWSSGWRIGCVFGLVCTAFYWFANNEKNPYHTDWGFTLAVLTRLFYFTILVLAVAAFKAKS